MWSNRDDLADPTSYLRKLRQPPIQHPASFRIDQREASDLDTASKLYLAAKHDNQPFNPADRGFEFSIYDIESYLEGVRASKITRAVLSNDRDAARRAAKIQSQAA